MKAAGRTGLNAIVVGCLLCLPGIGVAERVQLPYMMPKPPHPDHMGIATVAPAYSCEDATKLRLDEPQFATMEFIARVLVEAQFQKCALAEDRKSATPEHPASDHTVIVFTNPAATNANDKVFFGFAKLQALKEAERICAINSNTTAGRVSVAAAQGQGGALDVVGAAPAEAGALATATYSFMSLRCRGVHHAAQDDADVVVFIGPNAIVTEAKRRNLTDNVLRDVPLISSANREAIAAVVAQGRSDGLATPTMKVAVNWAGAELTTSVGKVFVRFLTSRFHH